MLMSPGKIDKGVEVIFKFQLFWMLIFKPFWKAQEANVCLEGNLKIEIGKIVGSNLKRMQFIAWKTTAMAH